MALAGAGHWAATARSVLGDSVDRYALDTEGFRFGDVDRLHDPNFLPGGAKYLDIPGLLLLGDMKSLWLAGEPASSQQRLRKAYSAGEVKGALTIVASSGSKSSVSNALDWILR